MDPGTPILLLLCLLGLAYFGMGARRSWRRRQVISQAPEMSISELRPGFFRARGRIKSSAVDQQAPMSQRTCAYYELEVDERRSSGRRRYWHTVVSDEGVSRVEMDDGTGLATIDLANAEVLFALDHHVSVGLLSSAPEHVERVLSERYATSTKGVVFNKKMRIRETFLELGDEIFVLGQVSFGKGGLEFGEGGARFVVSDLGFDAIIHKETRAFSIYLLVCMFLLGVLGLIALTMPS